MQKIIITKSLEKGLKKLGSIKLSDIIVECRKHTEGKGNAVILLQLPEGEVLKSYLLGKRVRMITFFRTKKGVYVPVWIVKKESTRGMNITKYDESFLLDKIGKHIADIEGGRFQEYEL